MGVSHREKQSRADENKHLEVMFKTVIRSLYTESEAAIEELNRRKLHS